MHGSRLRAVSRRRTRAGRGRGRPGDRELYAVPGASFRHLTSSRASWLYERGAFSSQTAAGWPPTGPEARQAECDELAGAGPDRPGRQFLGQFPRIWHCGIWARVSTGCALAALVSSPALTGCDQGSTFFGKAPAAAKLKAEAEAKTGEKDDWSHVPVPAPDGPKLAPLALVTPIYAKPDARAEAVGYLRVGARTARSPEPVSQRSCPAAGTPCGRWASSALGRMRP